MTTKDSIRSHGGRDFLPIRTVQIKTQSGVHVWSPREAKITIKINWGENNHTNKLWKTQKQNN